MHIYIPDCGVYERERVCVCVNIHIYNYFLKHSCLPMESHEAIILLQSGENLAVTAGSEEGKVIMH